jgi:hypothetical protein
MGIAILDTKARGEAVAGSTLRRMSPKLDQ